MTEPAEPFIVLARLLLAVTLLASGLLKLRTDNTTAKALEALGMTSKAIREVIGRVLPVVEIAVALWIVTGWQVRIGALFVFAMIVAFNVTLWRLQRLGYQGGCGCFGDEGSGPVRRVHLARNVVLLIAAGVLLREAFSPAVLDPLWAMPVSVLLGPAAMLVVAFLIYFLAAAAERLLLRAYWR